MTDILHTILARKHAEVAQAMQRMPLSQLQARLQQAAPVRGFAAAMRSTLLGVRDGSRIFGGARSSDRSVYGSLGGRLASMADDGFSPADVRLAWIAVYLLVLGFCIEEQEVRSNPDLYDDTFPPDTRAADFEATFAGLLDTAIAGIRTRSG